jgi:hypothetical protein
MPGSITEEKTGKLKSFYDSDSGTITEDGTGANFDFYQEGLSVIVNVGGDIIFIKVTTPSGKIIIRDIRGKASGSM